ncbi:hypothetical protein SAMD00023353_2600120 [Rosellinia necatrix]|uniref:UBC core domain-containing protein n=1 Tax=Rosellinia necatrix TaxID=77044 RepID=A0A1W2THD2_ROSNE|nr:hypothetical protein SAMD00023353_2600120 [Rosellinia necatrix]
MDPNIRKRIWKEIKDVNSDFFNLRTIIAPAPDDDFSQFYFAMSPNDGAMAHMTLAGCLYIPSTYPASPPVVHLYTKTGRYNVDVFRNAIGDKTRSTLCFDILRSKEHGGIWKPEYSISSLLASLMSAIVSFYVPQQHGGDMAEFVSMGKLRDVKIAAVETYKRYKHLLPSLPEIPLVKARMVPAKQMSFPATIAVESETLVTSGPIYLQTSDTTLHSFAADLSELHEGIVFSVVLSSSETDITGKGPDTVLVRNGVTATAARKCAGKPTQWFYHGKPMNDGDMRLHVTIGRDQMTLAYYSNGERYVHGDCPVSRLWPSQIGNVQDIPFYVHIYMKKKFGNPATIQLLDIEGKGYIHNDIEEMNKRHEDNDDDFGFEIVNASDIANYVKRSPEQADSPSRADGQEGQEEREIADPDRVTGEEGLIEQMSAMSI